MNKVKDLGMIDKIYFFEYSGYGGPCYVVIANSLSEAEEKLRKHFDLEYRDIVDDVADTGYELKEIGCDVYQTDYLGE